MTNFPNPHEYSAIHGVMRLLAYQNNYPADGTGSHLLSAQARNLLGSQIPPIMVDYTQSTQYNIFGDYPTSADIAPSALFTALFTIVTIAHISIFSINCYRGHYFWPQIGFIFYNICRILGFGLRIQWSKDLTQTGIGITSEVFLILPTVLIASFNLILAQRIFTWRHPVGGSRRLFWYPMLTLYAIVAGVVAMTIVASAGINLYLLGEPNYSRYKKVVQASSILIILYSLTSIALIGLAFFFKPTRKDENLYTYQPWWIKSFSPFYFVKKGESQVAAISFMKRNHNHRHAIRVIAATHHHYKMVKGLSNERGDLTHNVSMMIIFITTMIILTSSILRSVVCFQARMKYDRAPIGSPAMMYVWWGALEIIVNMLYLIGRIDLRFYRPDRLPKDVRQIVTADQSLYPSEIESVDEEKIDKYGHRLSYDDTLKGEEYEDNDDDDVDFYFDGNNNGGTSYDEDDDNDHEGFDFESPDKKKNNSKIPPYPYYEKRDDESEFHF
ncbi:uncharacterized protein KGF55_002231 [Candida pseudojiufengensis]|uniref:uncharacterized protein n=1 Tax=Candida pseudojiufengensis TaxID=497109 RepID=UPI0022245D9C|nr:uncharacterized protein KGF55_002231 [Candida pseudojiufengensis]KAI5964289.1 hypothetical protein KGF55_002231 [Candida pseudojiufengensis]